MGNLPASPVRAHDCELNWEAIQSMVFSAGDIKATLATSAPTGWLMLQGQTVNSAEYPGLAAALGISSATITLPDGRGRALIGAGTGPGLTARTLAATGGEETHTLSAAEMPAHEHNVNGLAHPFNATSGGALLGGGTRSAHDRASNTSDTKELIAQSQGGDGAHNNMQPWLAANLMVKT